AVFLRRLDEILTERLQLAGLPGLLRLRRGGGLRGLGLRRGRDEGREQKESRCEGSWDEILHLIIGSNKKALACRIIVVGIVNAAAALLVPADFFKLLRGEQV